MVYVGRLFNTAPYKPGAWRWKNACHMLADSIEELHAMADKIGLKRSWFQPKSVPHYDLTENMRRKAVKAGAQEIAMRQEGEMIRARRKSCL
ncbi:hypothetical protein LCGC14_1502180 [marine sediment metagenome]|uniref:DUF4031 domain-containing protein n=1 Tax=marine sediment metagenome TaxID=412755 RepID=A0A0F9J4A5_9ZZZZ